MGLFVCKKILEKAGGSINCFSEGFNKGATVTFEMRMVPPSHKNILTVVQEQPSIE